MSGYSASHCSVSSALSHVLNLFAVCAALFAAAYLIPRFADIFDDMLGGQPLPPLTEFVLHFRWLWFLVGIALFLTVIYVAWHYRLRHAPPSVSVGLLLLAAAQVGFIIYALFLPLCGTIVRMKS